MIASRLSDLEATSDQREGSVEETPAAGPRGCQARQIAGIQCNIPSIGLLAVA